MVEKSPNELRDFVDEAVFVAIDERAEEHTAHQGKDGGVGADAQRQRERNGDGKALGARQRAKCNS